MSRPSKVEKWSWIAGIVGTVIAAVAFFGSMFSGKDANPASTVTQQAGPNSTQIANNTGTVVIESSDSKANEPVDIVGTWDQKQARAMATAELEKSKWDSEKIGDPPYVHEFLRESNLVYKDRQAIVLTFQTKSKDFECHACAPYLSFFEFEKRPRGWKLTSSEIAAVQIGAWGEFRPDAISVRVIGDNLYGVFLESGYMAQGQTVSDVTLFARIGDSFREILTLALGEGGDSSGNWSSTINIKPTTTGLYDIIVERKGYGGPQDLKWVNGADELKADAADQNGNVRPEDIFKFDGRRYVRSDIFR
jgi:hypothetical protein